MAAVLADVLDQPVTNVSALGLLAFILTFLLKRMSRIDTDRDHRTATLEAEVTRLNIVVQAKNEEINAHRAEKHRAMNEAVELRNALRIIKRELRDCDCPQMQRVAILFDDL